MRTAHAALSVMMLIGPVKRIYRGTRFSRLASGVVWYLALVERKKLGTTIALRAEAQTRNERKKECWLRFFSGQKLRGVHVPALYRKMNRPDLKVSGAPLGPI